MISISQGRRGPNVGPGPAQIWRISGLVKSQTDGENAAVWSKMWCDLKKKRSSSKFEGFFRPKTSDLQKKVFELHMLIF